MTTPIDEVKTRIAALEQRVAGLDQRDTTLSNEKAAKTELSEIEKRTSSLENKIGIAVAIAVVLGLGGAGIGGLLLNAQDKIDKVSKQADAASSSVAALSSQIAETRNKIVADVDAAGKKAIGQLNETASVLSRTMEKDIASRLKVKFYQFCTGEYDAPCSPFPRFDPRDNPADKVAKNYCGPNVNYTMVKYREISGGCCGYAWYNLICTSFD